jgi:hypothetical protein
MCHIYSMKIEMTNEKEELNLITPPPDAKKGKKK